MEIQIRNSCEDFNSYRYAREGYLPGTPQDESLATWEPAIDRPPAFRPDLDLLPYLLTQNP